MRVKLDEGAFMPTKAHEADAGWDLRTREAVTVRPQSSAVIDTGVHVEIPDRYAGVLISKSGLNTKYSLTTTGLIDSGYTGSIRVKIYNHGDRPYVFGRGEKVSQLVIIPYLVDTLEQVDELKDTPRGDNGFGSSGR